jgi:hypothetical protein
MKQVISLLAIVVSALPVHSFACVTPPSGAVEPPPLTPVQRAQNIYRWSENIVYASNIAKTPNEAPQFKILHVYKGTYKTGDVISPRSSHGFDPPPCSGMITPRAVFPGEYGVIGFSGEPELRYINETDLRTMFDLKLIVSARAKPSD